MYNPNSPNNVKPPIKRKKFGSPEEFQQVVDTWIKKVKDEVITVQIPKTDRDGNIIIMERRRPPLIDTFCRDHGITHQTFWNYCNTAGYEAYFEIARTLIDYCNATILEYAMLGIVPENSAKFYLVNNSRYKDVSEVVHQDNSKTLPAWITGKKIEVAPKDKQVGGETIDYEEVKE